MRNHLHLSVGYFYYNTGRPLRYHCDDSVVVFWYYNTDIEPDSDSRDDGPSDKGRKYQENWDAQEQEEVVLVPRRNPRRLIRGYQRALSQLKSGIERSQDRIFFIKHMSAGSTHTIWYFVQVDMEQSYPTNMRNYGVYRCLWYIRKYADFRKYPTMECRFWP